MLLHEIRSLIERDKVELTLNEQLNRSDDVQALTEYVIGSARHVFLTLIYFDALEYIWDLRKQ